MNPQPPDHPSGASADVLHRASQRPAWSVVRGFDGGQSNQGVGGGLEELDGLQGARGSQRWVADLEVDDPLVGIPARELATAAAAPSAGAMPTGRGPAAMGRWRLEGCER